MRVVIASQLFPQIPKMSYLDLIGPHFLVSDQLYRNGVHRSGKSLSGFKADSVWLWTKTVTFAQARCWRARVAGRRRWWRCRGTPRSHWPDEGRFRKCSGLRDNPNSWRLPKTKIRLSSSDFLCGWKLKNGTDLVPERCQFSSSNSSFMIDIEHQHLLRWRDPSKVDVNLHHR